MKKRVKTWILAVTLVGSAVTNFSCSGMLTRQLRDAGINGVSTFVQSATVDLLDLFLPIDTSPSTTP